MFMCIYPCNSLQSSRLIRASRRYEPAIVHSTSHVWFRVRVDGVRPTRLPFTSPSFWLSLTPLLQISFSPQPTAAEKVKEGSYDFLNEIARQLAC